MTHARFWARFRLCFTGHFWKDENKYSCVNRSSIVSSSLRKESDAKLMALTELEISFNRKIYNAKIEYGGSTQKDVISYSKILETKNGSGHSEEILLANEPIRAKRKPRDLGSEID
ncbi:unnamed protein product, partial [Allacma fusca]